MTIAFLYARVGKPIAVQMMAPIESQSLEQMVNRVMAMPEDKNSEYCAKLIRSEERRA